MERIAVISDIHGNVPALDAVLEDIRRRGIERIFCLGDLIGKGPQSDLVVDRIREVCEIVIRGNWDDLIERPIEHETFAWHQRRLGPERIDYLTSLPFSHDIVLSGKLVRFVHASPQSVHHRVQPWHPFERRLAMFDNTELVAAAGCKREPDVVGYGDVHNAFVQSYRGKTLFNTGSVGNPLDVPQASYAVLEGVYGSDEAAGFGLQLVRVPYDIEDAVNIARDLNMPDLEPYVEELRTARYRGLKKQ
ncbi:metallophosphoesterase family protein [Numidum massiliense]|uniref:metallophosphoesterase family protein n=1 Tax=Numidum massiliense TaxID=1522315 RepID=UPI0006D55572|nr:metallophosphoesterase family protein [Numidum massiliense]